MDAASVAELLRGRRWVALTGAGMSTDSGIPDYRGPSSIRATPMLYGEFVGSVDAQRRYWARSYQGWQRIGQAEPNAGHRALAALESSGLVGVITQNVDGLHRAAGSTRVVELHGAIARVICLDCRELTTRRELQARLGRLNRSVAAPRRLEHAELRPDGDAAIDDWSGFAVAPCLDCGGRLKPDVVFFGESVPKERVEAAFALLHEAEVLVVLGSSLTVMSGLRFVRQQARRELPTVIVNRGATRGDELATVKLEDGCSETLARLAELLAGAQRPAGSSRSGAVAR